MVFLKGGSEIRVLKSGFPNWCSEIRVLKSVLKRGFLNWGSKIRVLKWCS